MGYGWLLLEYGAQLRIETPWHSSITAFFRVDGRFAARPEVFVFIFTSPSALSLSRVAVGVRDLTDLTNLTDTSRRRPTTLRLLQPPPPLPPLTRRFPAPHSRKEGACETNPKCCCWLYSGPASAFEQVQSPFPKVRSGTRFRHRKWLALHCSFTTSSLDGVGCASSDCRRMGMYLEIMSFEGK